MVQAEFIDGLCQRYHCLPSQLLQEDGHLLLSMLAVLGLAGELGQATAREPQMDPMLAGLAGLAETLG